MNTTAPTNNPTPAITWHRIYVLHPFRGQGRPGERKANQERIAIICRHIMRRGFLPISPVHALSFLDDNHPGDRDDAIRLCQPLIELADEVWAFVIDGRTYRPGDPTFEWIHSAGCRADHELALQLHKPITYHPYQPLTVCETAVTGV